jgi:alkylated DNA nucleotide flippase Atl1
MNLIVTDLASREAASIESVVAHEIEFVVGDCALGKVLVARSPIGVCAILFGSTAEEVEQDLAIPCHRVMGNSGSMAGYHWGIERKQALINKEIAT